MTSTARSGLRWLRTQLLACGLMAAAAVGAQPVVGQVYEGSLPTEQGYDVPLPEARWRVTQVANQPHTGFALGVVVLRNLEPKAQLPYLFVRYALNGWTWTSPCQEASADAFDVNTHWTLPNQILNKCSRKFVALLPSAASSGWWAGLHQGIEPGDTALQQAPLLMSEISLMVDRGLWVRVEAFMRTDVAGIAPADLRGASWGSAGHPWNFATQIWAGRYLIALERAALKKQPAKMEAFELPSQNSVEARLWEMGSWARNETAPTVPVDDHPVAESLRPMADARPPAADRAPPEPVVATLTVATPAVSAAEFAKLAAELARLRDELKSRPQAEPPAQAVVPAVVPAVAVVPAAAVAPPASHARRLAMVIGNDAYQSVARLQNARTDARAMAEVLARVGYQVRLRTDLNERAMKDELRAFKSEIQGGDEVLFYFAGHGVQLAGANYLLPTDIRGEAEDQVRDDALLLQKVLDDIQERKARFALAIVDACRDNPFRTAGRNLGGRGLAPTSAATGQMVMFSAGAGQQALDRLGERDQDPNGLFTRILLKEMDRRELSVDRVLRAVRNQVVALARSVGHEQVPALYDQSIGEFYFRR